MSENKHTPGPYRTSKINFSEDNWQGLHSGKYPKDCVMSGSDVLAVVWGDESGNDAENARLFAAAPRLLKALDTFVEMITEEYRANNHSEEEIFEIIALNPEFQEGIAALAQARGEMA